MLEFDSIVSHLCVRPCLPRCGITKTARSPAVLSSPNRRTARTSKDFFGSRYEPDRCYIYAMSWDDRVALLQPRASWPASGGQPGDCQPRTHLKKAQAFRRSEINRSERRRCVGSSLDDSRAAVRDSCRSRNGIFVQSARRAVLPAWGKTRLHPARQPPRGWAALPGVLRIHLDWSCESVSDCLHFFQRGDYFNQ